MSGAAARLIPSYGLDLAHVPLQEREEAWREAFGEQWDTPEIPEVFEPGGRGFDLGKAVLADTTHPALNFVRDAGRIRRDGVDNIYILTQVTGGYRAATDARDRMIGPGQVTLFDIAQPVARHTSPGRTLCLAVARDVVEPVLPGVDLHAVTLGPMGGLMAEHLVSLRRNLPDMERSAARHIVQSTALMLAACVQPTAERVDRARPALRGALLARAKRHIRANCADPKLTPASVAAAVGASRTSLYRAFEPEGGVAEYLRKARLEAARSALLDPSDGRRIGDIAFAYGFSSEAQFSRAMRAAFGAPPSELRRGVGGLYVRLKDDKWVLKGWRGASAPPTPADAETGQVISWPGNKRAG